MFTLEEKVMVSSWWTSSCFTLLWLIRGQPLLLPVQHIALSTFFMGKGSFRAEVQAFIQGLTDLFYWNVNINLFLSNKLHHRSLLLFSPAVWIRNAHIFSLFLRLHFTISTAFWVFAAFTMWLSNLCFLKLCSKLPPISAAWAWCSGDNILLIRCSPTSYQYKQQAHSLTNEFPGELTLLACCLNAFQMRQSLSFSFPSLVSHTITHLTAAFNS